MGHHPDTTGEPTTRPADAAMMMAAALGLLAVAASLLLSGPAATAAAVGGYGLAGAGVMPLAATKAGLDRFALATLVWAAVGAAVFGNFAWRGMA
jgi:hypothetical protein